MRTGCATVERVECRVHNGTIHHRSVNGGIQLYRHVKTGAELLSLDRRAVPGHLRPAVLGEAAADPDGKVAERAWALGFVTPELCALATHSAVSDGRDGRAAAILHTWMAIDPSSQDAAFALAGLALRAGRLGRARDLLGGLDRPDHRRLLGDVLERMGDLAGAAGQQREIARADPHPVEWCRLGDLARANGDLALASVAYGRAAELGYVEY